MLPVLESLVHCIMAMAVGRKLRGAPGGAYGGCDLSWGQNELHAMAITVYQ